MCASIRSFEVMLFFRDLNIALYEKIEMEGGSIVSRGKEIYPLSQSKYFYYD